jgi:ABC-type multidrug transport system permease subunit
MSAVGGSMIPLFIMPPVLQKIALLSVNYWGIQGFYDLFWRSLPLEAILPRILVLMGIGFIMTLTSILLFRKRIIRM